MHSTHNSITKKFLDEICATATQAAESAGKILLDNFGRELQIDVAHTHDLKLELDRLCEQIIIKTIKSVFPNHKIITEEGSSSPVTDSEYIWIVDPLDGTMNFYHGIPYYCTCVACYYHGAKTCNSGTDPSDMFGSPLVGVVYAPSVNELFTGIAGYGATCNGKPTEAAKECKLSESMIAMSFGSDELTKLRMEHICSVLIRRARKIRVFGATGLDIANVACGRISGLIQGCVRIWDFAASRIILEESGGNFETDIISSDCCEILACAPGIYSSLYTVWKS